MGRYVIVGNGVTGTRAAEVLRRKDADAAITLVTDEPYPFYRRPQLADYASGQAGEARLWAKPASFYDDNRLDLRLETTVTGVDPAAKVVSFADGGSLPYDKLLVASGRRLSGVGSAALPSVNSFKTLDEAKAIRSMDGAGKRGIVYGDGLVALELVRALTGAGFQTTYYVPGERLWPDVLDDDAAEIAASRVRAAGAEIVFKTAIKAVREGASGSAELLLDSGLSIGGDVVGVCSQYAPAVSFLPEGGVAALRGSSYATPWPDVYIAGDVTVGPETRYFNWLRSWRQGAAVGAAMAEGSVDTFEDVDTLNMQILGLSLVALGKTVTAYRSGYSEMRGEPVGEFYKKLVFDPEGILVGALLVGNVAEAAALEEAIRARTPKDGLDAALLHQMFDLSYRRPAFIGVQCPVCRHEFQVGRGAQEGDLVTCPVCGVDLSLARGPEGFIARAAR